MDYNFKSLVYIKLHVNSRIIKGKKTFRDLKSSLLLIQVKKTIIYTARSRNKITSNTGSQNWIFYRSKFHKLFIWFS